MNRKYREISFVFGTIIAVVGCGASGGGDALECGERAQYADHESWQVPAWAWSTGYQSGDYARMATVDMHGDGLPDLVFLLHPDDMGAGQQYWLVHRNTGVGFSIEPELWSLPFPAPTTSDLDDWDHRWTLLDINGDGRPELIDLSTEYSSSSPGSWLVYDNLGTGFSLEPRSWQVPIYAWTTSYERGDGERMATVDMHGDGLPDLVFLQHPDDVSVGYQHWLVHRNTGVGFSIEPELWSLPFPAPMTSDLDGWDRRWTLLDIDGDRSPELIDLSTGYSSSSPSSWHIYDNEGTGFSLEPRSWQVTPYAWTTSYQQGDDERMATIDVHGDGLPDLVFLQHPEDTSAGFQRWLVHRNTGAEFLLQPEIWTIPFSARTTSESEDLDHRWSLFDIDGNGRPELIDLSTEYGSSQTGNWLVYKAACAQD